MPAILSIQHFGESPGFFPNQASFNYSLFISTGSDQAANDNDIGQADQKRVL